MSNEIVRWRCEAVGLVQRVGYRDRVRRAAKELGLTGWVANDPQDEDRVMFEAQGSASSLQKLLETVGGPAGLGNAKSVTRLEVLSSDPSHKAFAIRRDPDSQKEMAERMDEAALYLGASFEVGKEALGVGKETLRVGKETLSVGKETLSVGKETLSAVRTGNEFLGKKIDGLAGKVDNVADAVRAEGRQNAEFRHELAQAVAHLDRKYGAISKTLGRIEKALEKQTKAATQASERQTAAILKLASQVAHTNSRVRKPLASGRR